MKKIILSIIILVFTIFGIFALPSYAQNTSTQDAALQQKVQDKLNAVLANPKAFIGSVTDRSDTTLQIKSIDSQIEQITVDGNTTFVKVTKGVSSGIKYTDVAIGDFVIAMGTKTSDSILNAKRIVVTASPDDNKKESHLVRVTDTSKTNITVGDLASGKSFIVEPADNTTKINTNDSKNSKIRLTDINDGDTLIIIGQFQGSNFEATRIFVTTPAPTATPTTKATPTSKPTKTPTSGSQY